MNPRLARRNGVGARTVFPFDPGWVTVAIHRRTDRDLASGAPYRRRAAS
jgi:hypothetical protein